jgi:hypothetical protein
VTLLPILSVKAHSSLVQEAARKVQDSSLPDLLCSRPAVPFMQPPLDEESGLFGSITMGMSCKVCAACKPPHQRFTMGASYRRRLGREGRGQ